MAVVSELHTTTNGHVYAPDDVFGGPRVWSHDDFLAEDFPQPKPLIDGLLASNMANNWSGPSGTGKTWFALAAARAIAGRHRFLGQFATALGRVVIIDQESYRAGLQDRLRMLNAADPLPRGSPLFLAPTKKLFVDDDELDPSGGYAAMRRICETYSPDVLFLDSYTRFHRINENDAGAVADVNARFASIIEDYGCAIVLLDHTRKPSPLAANDEPANRLRGSSEKRAFVDAALALEAKGDEGEIVVTPTKSRWCKSPEPFAVRLDVDPVEGTARMVYIGPVSREASAVPGLILEAIHALKAQVGEDGATVATLAGYLGVSEGTVRKHLGRLEAAGLVRRRQRPKQPGANGRPPDCYDVGELK